MYDAKSEEIGPGIYRFKAEIGENPTAFSQCVVDQPLRANALRGLAQLHSTVLTIASEYGYTASGHVARPLPQSRCLAFLPEHIALNIIVALQTSQGSKLCSATCHG